MTKKGFAMFVVPLSFLLRSKRSFMPRAGSAPDFSLLAAEPLRAFCDFLASHRPVDAMPAGHGEPVFVFPGLGGGAWSTARLREKLSAAGFDVHDWGLGINTGPGADLDAWVSAMDGGLADLYHETGRRVTLIGWSLGGLFARELAKRHPSMVRQVITLGTPWKNLDTGTHASAIYKILNRTTRTLTPSMRTRLARRPCVPLTAIYSRKDGIVAWKSCVIRNGANVESIEVNDASHLGMGTNPEVLRIIADRIAQPEERWTSWHAPRQQGGVCAG